MRSTPVPFVARNVGGLTSNFPDSGTKTRQKRDCCFKGEKGKELFSKSGVFIKKTLYKCR